MGAGLGPSREGQHFHLRRKTGLHAPNTISGGPVLKDLVPKSKVTFLVFKGVPWGSQVPDRLGAHKSE